MVGGGYRKGVAGIVKPIGNTGPRQTIGTTKVAKLSGSLQNAKVNKSDCINGQQQLSQTT